ncbi:MAG: c-type cytochrome [Hyphomicrobiales bacterium]|nr:c-type cytochrome [Hyphomicrobiales bacterium]
MKAKWLIIAAAAVAFGLAGAAGSAQAANTAACSGCHGANGEGKAANPKIAGMSTGAFTSAMNAYKSGAKKHAAMNAVTKNLSAGDIAEMANFFASK